MLEVNPKDLRTTGLPKGKTSRVVFSTEELTNVGLNDYSRKTKVDDLGGRFHATKSETYGQTQSSRASFEVDRLISNLCFNLNLSQTLRTETGEEYSYEENALVPNIDAKEFKKKFPEKYDECLADVHFLTIFGDIDKYVRSGVGHNVRFYDNGEYTLFDFDCSKQFFRTDFWDAKLGILKLLKENYISDREKKILTSKLIEFKTFYSSPEGHDLFHSNISRIKVPFSTLFIGFSGGPEEFLKEVLRRVDLYLYFLKSKRLWLKLRYFMVD
jgi:hypothetical protein